MPKKIDPNVIYHRGNKRETIASPGFETKAPPPPTSKRQESGEPSVTGEAVNRAVLMYNHNVKPRKKKKK